MAEPAKTGDPVIDFNLTDIDGVRHDSREARNAGLLLYAIYKKGCGTCQFTAPFLQRFQDFYAGPGFQIWGLAQDSPDETREFASKFSLTFPLLIDEGLEVTEQHHLISVPAIHLVDSSDRILLSALAFDSEALNAMAELIAERTGRPHRPIVTPEDNAPKLKPG